MEKHIKNVIVLLAVLMAACVALMAFGIVFLAQYSAARAGMVKTVATVVDTNLSGISKYGHTQDIIVSYEVNGEKYEREIGSDTSISFDAGAYAHASEGDKVNIYYDAADPNRIVAERSQIVSIVAIAFSALSFAFFTAILIVTVKANKKNHAPRVLE